MKKLLLLLSLVFAGLAVSSCYDDSELWESVNELDERVKVLERLCSEMNTNIQSLQGLVSSVGNGAYITNVETLTENRVEVGFKITLSNGKTMVIYHGKDGIDGQDGKDGVDGSNGETGYVPAIGVKKDGDGLYYWTMDGEWLLDDEGQKIPVSGGQGTDGQDGSDGKPGKDGVTPELKIEGEKWYVSYDEGKTWNELGPAVSGSASVFDDVTYEDGVLTFVFADGEVVTFAVKEAFRIEIGEYEAGVGSTVEIPYTIVGATGEVTVFPIASYGDSADYFFIKEHIEETPYSGRIIVYRSWEMEEKNGKFGIFAVDESGTTVSKVIRLTSSVMYVDDEKYLLGPEASALSVKVAANRKYEVSTNADWITYVETKAVEEKTLVFDIKENDGLYRNAEIYIISGKKKITLPVYQKASGDQLFSVKLKTSLLDWNAGSFTVYVGDGDEYGDVEMIRNAKGQTVAEALGYGSWEEVVEAAGDFETICRFAGDVVITPFDPMTGESYGIGHNETSYGNALVYRLGKNGELDRYGYMLEFWWGVNWENNMLYPYFNVDIEEDYINPGDSYICGIMLSTETTDVMIEIAMEVEDYTDPEEGIYDDPAAPGKYTFNIDEQFDIQAIVPEDTWPVTQIPNFEVYEIIKSTMGMTSYDLFLIRNEVEDYFLFEDERLSYDSGFSLDISGSPVGYWDDGYEQRILDVYWNAFDLEPQLNFLQFNTFFENRDWNSYVINAAVRGTVLKFQYVLKYGGYELVFNFNVKFELIESEDPESGLYDDPAAPGTYEFDIYDKIQISDPEFYNNAVYNRDFYEKIKETLGMTSYELSRNSYKFDTYWYFSDGYQGEKRYYSFDMYGNPDEYDSWDSTVVTVEWRIGVTTAANNCISMWMPYNYDMNRWTDPVIEAARAGKEIKYRYVVRYEDYELIFNHTIGFEETEYNDPEAGLFDDPAAPGTYEFDIVDEYVISRNDAGKDNQAFDAMAYKPNNDTWTIIRQTLGMTSSELYLVRYEPQFYYILDDESKMYGSNFTFDMNGQPTSWDDENLVCGGSYNHCSSHREDGNYRWLTIPWTSVSQSGGCDWSPAVYEAAALGTVIKYKYVMEYAGYKLIFNHSVKFDLAE